MIAALKNITIAGVLVAGVSFFHSPSGQSETVSTQPIITTVKSFERTNVRLPASAQATFIGRNTSTQVLSLPSDKHGDVLALTSLAPSPVQKIRIVGSSVNLRAGPTTADAVVGRLKKDDLAVHLGQTSGDWIKVSFGQDTEVAWMHGSFAQMVQTKLVLAQN